MPEHEHEDCDSPEIISVRARQIFFPAKERRPAVELTVVGRNLPDGALPIALSVGDNVLRNLEWMDRNTLRGILVDGPERPAPLFLQVDNQQVVVWESYSPDSVEGLE